jgi:hypothetical protein
MPGLGYAIDLRPTTAEMTPLVGCERRIRAVALAHNCGSRRRFTHGMVDAAEIAIAPAAQEG